jgi:hypothetical protein
MSMNDNLTKNHNDSNNSNMKNKMTSLFAASATAVTVLLAGSAQANMLTPGSTIEFGGQATLNSSDPSAATQVSSWAPTPITAGEVSGSFASQAGIVGSTPTFLTPWVFLTLPANGLWTDDGFTFDLKTITTDQVSGSPASLVIDGNGTVSGNGYDATPGSFSFSTEGFPIGTAFTFAAGTTTGAVPDGGLTLATLGSVFVALAGIRSRFGKQS